MFVSLSKNIKIMREIRNLKERILITMMSIFSIFCLTECKKEGQISSIEQGVTAIGLMPDGVRLAATGITSSSYYLINSLPSGYVKDGTRDYTSYIQAAVTKYSNVVFPNFPVLVNDAGINIGSNKTITFPEGSEIRLKASSKDKYHILKISNASNVTLYNPVIVGDRTTHTGTSGEWGMGIGILGSSSITVYSPKVTNCWGDGIYLGQYDNRVNCKNIIIKDAYLKNNRRDGMSVIGIDGLLLDNIYSGYNSGTAPGTGINFEANNASCEIKNIRINNPVTEFNGERGIQVTAHHILNSSVNKYSDITVVNHIDKSSPFSAFKLSLKNLDGTSAKMFGLIKFVNPSWQRTLNNRPLHVMTDQAGYKISVSSPDVINSSGSLLSWTDTYNLLMKAGSNVTVSQVAEVISDPVTEPVVSPVSPSAGSVVFAVNAGGTSFTAANGITYNSDKNYSNGSVFRKTVSVNLTTDDILYQSERFGNFSYDIPVSNGTYEITFRLAEIFHTSSGKRRFDILAEKQALVSNLDIFAVAGFNNAYNIVKTVEVIDGTLDIDFNTDLDNAKISAFHVIRK